MNMNWLPLTLVIAGLITLPASHAQDPPVPEQDEMLRSFYKFDMQVEDTDVFTVTPSQAAEIGITFRDRSRDTPTALLPDGSPRFSTFYHSTTFNVNIVEGNPDGWVIVPLSGFQTIAGEERDLNLRVLVDATASDPYLRVQLQAVTETEGGTFTQNASLLFFTPGIPGFNIRPGASHEMGPRDLETGSLIIRNNGLLPRLFQVEPGDNPCGVDLVTPGTVLVQAKEERLIQYSVQAPEAKPYYNNEDCSVAINAYATDNPSVTVTTVVGVIVTGPYVDPVWVFWTIGIIAAIILIALLAKRQKERLNEEILGKPQKPWEIPAEKVYLEHLKEKDERAWYVVRHFLMEDEYASSLAWYHAYKGATKGERKKERLIVKQEQDLEAWEAAWQERIAVPAEQADRYEAKLQKKLEKTAKKRRRRSLRKWRKQTRKLEKAHAKQQERALEKWEKKAKRADKKGRDIPEKPVVPEPETPEEPRKQPAVLADHPWQAKADRFRARMAAVQDRLEARFAAQRERRVKKVQKKVRKVAKRLDDPDFVAEHPLLAEGQDEKSSS